MRALELPRRNDDPDFAAGSVHFVGTATVILRYAGFTILPDPNFLHSGTHPHLGYGLTARRLTDPAVEMDDLPPIDLVVLSHLHGDLFDRVVERRLNRGTPIISTRHAVRYLKRKGFTATHAMNTWESMEVIKGEARMRLSAMPGTHAPGLLERILPPVMGSTLEFRREDEDVRLRLYITGDTLIHERLREIPRRLPGVDLALLHLGGTRVLGVLVTMDADQGVEMEDRGSKGGHPHTLQRLHGLQVAARGLQAGRRGQWVRGPNPLPGTWRDLRVPVAGGRNGVTRRLPGKKAPDVPASGKWCPFT